MIDYSSTKRSWDHMKQRCLNHKNHAYHRYGGRGIKICDSWLESFDNFVNDMGVRPSLKYSLERKDSNKGYCKSNCRWATSREQNNNKDSTHSLIHLFEYSPKYTKDEISSFELIDELKETFDNIRKCYPLANLEGSIKLLACNDKIATFGILISANMSNLNIGDRVYDLTLSKPFKIKKNNRVVWEWSCVCGKNTTARICDVISGNTKSCGCLHERTVKTHGMKKSKIYRVWDYLKQKCYNPRCDLYRSFGGAGITVSDEWRNSFVKFYSDMGDPPSRKHRLKLKAGKTIFNKENSVWEI